MTAPTEDQYLHLEGMIHRIDIAPAGTAENPWPFVLMINDGQGRANAMIHYEDAVQIVEFFQRHGAVLEGSE